MKVLKCPHCNKILFDVGSDICPFCKKNLKEDVLDIFRELLGIEEEDT